MPLVNYYKFVFALITKIYRYRTVSIINYCKECLYAMAKFVLSFNNKTVLNYWRFDTVLNSIFFLIVFFIYSSNEDVQSGLIQLC